MWWSRCTASLSLTTKNYRGWIFGRERDRLWTQQIYSFRTTFQNPLRQNFKHPKFLKAVAGVGLEKIYSVVVFTGSAELKTDLPAHVLHLSELVGYIANRNEQRLAPEEVARIEAQLHRIKKRTLCSDHIAHSYRLLRTKRGTVPATLPSLPRMAARMLLHSGLLRRFLAASGILVLLVMAVNAPLLLTHFLPPEKETPPALLQRINPRTVVRPAAPAKNQRHRTTSAEQARPRKGERSRAVLYSWTTRDGKRAYSNVGFPKEGDYVNAQIEWSK